MTTYCWLKRTVHETVLVFSVVVAILLFAVLAFALRPLLILAGLIGLLYCLFSHQEIEQQGSSRSYEASAGNPRNVSLPLKRD